MWLCAETARSPTIASDEELLRVAPVWKPSPCDCVSENATGGNMGDNTSEDDPPRSLWKESDEAGRQRPADRLRSDARSEGLDVRRLYPKGWIHRGDVGMFVS